MSLSPLFSFKSRFVTYLLNFPRKIRQNIAAYTNIRHYIVTVATCFDLK